MALPRKNRLHLKKDFDLLKKEGIIVQNPLFGTLFLATETKNPLFGIVISKKISPKAVERNKARRRLSEAARLLLPKIKPNYKILILAKKPILSAKFQDIYFQLEETLKKIKCLS